MSSPRRPRLAYNLDALIRRGLRAHLATPPKWPSYAVRSQLLQRAQRYRDLTNGAEASIAPPAPEPWTRPRLRWSRPSPGANLAGLSALLNARFGWSPLHRLAW